MFLREAIIAIYHMPWNVLYCLNIVSKLNLAMEQQTKEEGLGSAQTDIQSTCKH